MKKILILAGTALLSFLLSGCTGLMNDQAPEQPPMVVTRITEPVVLDGKLDEPFWAKLPKHELVYDDEMNARCRAEAIRARKEAYEGAWVKVAYDDKYVYIAAQLEDDDVISYAKKHGGHLYLMADTLEIFFWPTEKVHYWEMYATPSGHKNNYAYPAGGVLTVRRYLGAAPDSPGLEIASQVCGKINDRTSRDQYWTTEMRISRKMFADAGVEFAPGQSWRMLAARYNYSGLKYRRQNSTYPALPIYSFHLRNYYAPVEFR